MLLLDNEQSLLGEIIVHVTVLSPPGVFTYFERTNRDPMAEKGGEKTRKDINSSLADLRACTYILRSISLGSFLWRIFA